MDAASESPVLQLSAGAMVEGTGSLKALSCRGSRRVGTGRARFLKYCAFAEVQAIEFSLQ